MDSAAQLKELMLLEPWQSLAVAESMTAGHVQARIAAIAGASEYFVGGITAYTLDQKVRHLAVDRGHAAAVNCVSTQVAVEMARGATALFGADVAVATTGYAEASPAEHVAEPMAYWALAHAVGPGRVVVRSGRVELPGATRTAAQQQVAEVVLGELVAYLRDWRDKKTTAG